MKKLICEMCEGIDFVKHEGVFACQSCGTKYSVEEAKKMMIEGTVEVAGTVKVDNAGKLDNLFKLARRAKDEHNTEKAAQYYEQIQLEDPLNWESAFYSIYYSAIQKWRTGEEGVALSLLRNCIDNVINIIIENISEKKEQISVANEVSKELSGICSAFCNANKEAFESFYDRYQEVEYSSHNSNLFKQCLQKTTSLNCRISEIYYVLGEKILGILANENTLNKKAETLMEQANITARNNPCDFYLSVCPSYSPYHSIKKESNNYISEMEKMVSNGIKKITQKEAAAAKRRFKEYWDTHKSEKTKLENEKKSLSEQITALNQEIIKTPEKTDGYVNMLELQKKAQDLASEKAKIGLLKLKEKKATQNQIDSVNAEIALIQSRIDSAIDAVKKRIPSLENRIKAIDVELTKPR